jgi:Restriction endonuclease BglII.
MRIVEQYSHLNGLEFLLVHKPKLWEEIQQVIAGIDAESCRTKVSKEKRTKDKVLFSPIDMNKRMSEAFADLGWGERRTSYWVTSNAQLIRKTMSMAPAEQKSRDRGGGLEPDLFLQSDRFCEGKSCCRGAVRKIFVCCL